ncbi:disease resistance protein RLM3-like isoform X2 [Hevea brasiliensis]|uniref:disease resistance protein RLM3-like isoform X2 n=1 Tax=Hevea brasiliensis TaxID=3981 RepID=UPI000B76F62A|nr:disease resistance protein RLM3-like isoform X2 [Hevea brasiliensis]
MASTSLSTPPRNYGYDAFINFRGKDIRRTFLSHLIGALRRKHINAFKDENLRKGEKITPRLLQIIEESRVSIVIFSTNYADSSWCLDELVKILQCYENLKQIVKPLFFKVNTNDVQDLTGKFGKAFSKLRGELKVPEWTHALMEVSQFAAWESKKFQRIQIQA